MRTSVRMNLGGDCSTSMPERRWGGTDKDIPVLDLDPKDIDGPALQFYDRNDASRDHAVEWLRALAREAAALADEIEARHARPVDLTQDQIEAACREIAMVGDALAADDLAEANLDEAVADHG